MSNSKRPRPTANKRPTKTTKQSRARSREDLSPTNAQVTDAQNRQPEPLLTAQQVATYFGSSTDWVYDHVNRHEPRLRAVRLCHNRGRGRTLIRFRPEDVQEFVDRQLDPPKKRGGSEGGDKS